MMTHCWWDITQIGDNGVTEKYIGPIWVAVKKNKSEWQLHVKRQDPFDSLELSFQESVEITEDTLLERFFYDNKSSQVQFFPYLADRPVVSRPVRPFSIPSKQKATIYVSTPLWLGVRIGASGTLTLIKEIPVLRPSDTWFGPNTISGELCYSSKTSARLSLEELPKRSHRAITPIIILNESNEHLLVDRVNLPVPYLCLYETEERMLWTQAVKLTRKHDSEIVSLEIIDGPPVEIPTARLFSEPRLHTEEKTIISKISSFFA
ncbi:MAG: DUF432 domain-containing protein [Desulfobulbaceae bacterium]|nr:DUF432 domain-containing protein [Desulfobulbaceae bacterium]